MLVDNFDTQIQLKRTDSTPSANSGLVNGLQSFNFSPCHSSYGALAFTHEELTPSEHASIS